MRKLLFIIVLFFSTSVFAKIFDCTLKWGDFGDSFNILVDTGNKIDGTLSVLNYEGKFEEIAGTIFGVGKIYITGSNPITGFSKSDHKYFITNDEGNYYNGIVFHKDYPFILSIREYENPTEIEVLDSFGLDQKVYLGVCI